MHIFTPQTCILYTFHTGIKNMHTHVSKVCMHSWHNGLKNKYKIMKANINKLKYVKGTIDQLKHE